MRRSRYLDRATGDPQAPECRIALNDYAESLFFYPPIDVDGGGEEALLSVRETAHS